MIIKNYLILEDGFIDSFSKLMLKKMPAKQCLEVSACLEELISHHTILVRTRRAIADKFCKKNESGIPLRDDRDNLVFDSEEDRKKCYEELKEIHEEEIDIPLTNKIKIYEDELCTPREILLLKDIIDIVER